MQVKQRKHMRVPIDQSQGALVLWVHRQDGQDKYKVVVYFKGLLFGKYEMATSFDTMSKEHAEIYSRRVSKKNEIDLFYWRPHH